MLCSRDQGLQGAGELLQSVREREGSDPLDDRSDQGEQDGWLWLDVLEPDELGGLWCEGSEGEAGSTGDLLTGLHDGG